MCELFTECHCNLQYIAGGDILQGRFTGLFAAFWSAAAAATAFLCFRTARGIRKRQLRLPHSKLR